MQRSKKKIDSKEKEDESIGKHGLPPHTTKAKITTELQNNYHPKSWENQAAWKSNNQGIKEITPIQTSKGVETQRHKMGGSTPMCCG